MSAEAKDWVRIADLYERLARVTGSPVVEVNRAVALRMAYGPQAGLALLDQLDGLPALSGYHLLPSVRGDLLDKLGRHEEARAEFARAAGMTLNEQERRLLLNRAAGGQPGRRHLKPQRWTSDGITVDAVLCSAPCALTNTRPAEAG